jgi:hypothetical protein
MKTLFLLSFLWAPLFAIAQSTNGITPYDPVCQNEVVTYTAPTGVLFGSITWEVYGGVFTTTNTNKIENTLNRQQTVRWNSNFHDGTIKIVQGGANTFRDIKLKIGDGRLILPSFPGGNIACGNTNSVSIAVYIDRDASFPEQGSLDGPNSISLPSGWSVTSKSYIGPTQINGVDVYQYNVYLQPDATSGGTISVRNSLNCAGGWTYSNPATMYVTRTPSGTSRTISGISSLCSGSASYSLNTEPGDHNFNWTTGSGLYVSSGQGTANTQLAVNGNGNSFATVTFQDACGNPLSSPTKDIIVGTPQIAYPNLWLFDANSNMWQFSHDYSPGASWNYYVAAGSASLVQNVGDCYITTQSGASVCVYGTNSCGQGSTYCFDVPAGGGMMRAAPNPAKNNLTLQLNTYQSLKEMPSQIELYPENSTKAVKIVSTDDLKKSFTNSDQLDLDVSNLARGVYYLHIIPKAESKQSTQRIRIILE